MRYSSHKAATHTILEDAAFVSLDENVEMGE